MTFGCQHGCRVSLDTSLMISTPRFIAKEIAKSLTSRLQAPLSRKKNALIWYPVLARLYNFSRPNVLTGCLALLRGWRTASVHGQMVSGALLTLHVALRGLRLRRRRLSAEQGIRVGLRLRLLLLGGIVI